MVRPLPATYLQPGEAPLTVQDRRMLSVLDGYLAILIISALLIGSLLFFVTVAPALAPIIFLPALLTILTIAALSGFLLYRRTGTTRYIVTAERVYAAMGRLVFRLDQTTYDKVTDMQVHQSFFGRMFGFGTVTIQTAGHGLRLAGVNEPFAVKQAIEEARSSYLDTLIERHLANRPQTRAETSWRPVPKEGDAEATASSPTARRRREDVPVWNAGPARAWFGTTVVSSVTSLLIPLAFVSVALGAAAGPSFIPLAIGGFLLIGGIAATGAYIQYRHTRYEIRSRGVVVTRGWLSRRRTETSYDKVTDVSVNQGVIARMFDYGTITVNTAGSNVAPVIFAGVHNPDDVKRIIDRARHEDDA